MEPWGFFQQILQSIAEKMDPAAFLFGWGTTFIVKRIWVNEVDLQGNVTTPKGAWKTRMLTPLPAICATTYMVGMSLWFNDLPMAGAITKGIVSGSMATFAFHFYRNTIAGR